MIIHDCPQGSDEWFALRCGIPTGSEFSKLVTSQAKPSKSMAEYAAVLAAEAYAGHPVDAWTGNQYTDRGKELEAAARATYEFENNVEVQEVGFITDNLKRWGASPDGLVSDDGMTEYKCQIAKRHIKTLLYYRKHGKCEPEYYAQCQGEMFIAERQWNDLVFYHPDLPTITIRQTPDPAFVEMLKQQLQVVCTERDIIVQMLREV